MSGNFKRIVTGHDAEGNSIISSCGPPPARFEIQSVPGLVFHEIWRTGDSPVPIRNEPDPTTVPLSLVPTPQGSVIRVLDIPAGDVHEHDADAAAASFAEIGASGALASGKSRGSSHAHMHRTETVDYGILISGEIWLVMDEGEVKLNPGDICIQRGTNHAWSNRGDVPARLVFILLDGRFAEGIS